MIILGIETSCDETSLALINSDDVDSTRIRILSHVTLSQTALHEQYGGVVPNLAKREHSKNLIPLFKQLLTASGLQYPASKNSISVQTKTEIDRLLEREPELLQQFLEYLPTLKKPPIDRIAVTEGPGLEPALWVGINFAKALSAIWTIPIVPINHMEGHVAIALLQKKRESFNSEFFVAKPTFPAIALLISGGHTELVLMKEMGTYELIGQTRDDAVGEAFDKVARILGLPYPGGPEISRLAEKARTAGNKHPVPLPRPMQNADNFDFSFSGLKTAVLYMVKKIGTLTEQVKETIAREFEDAAADVIIHKTEKAIDTYNARTLIVGGGVTANVHIRRELEKFIASRNEITLHTATREFSTDNALMIALAGTLRHHTNAKHTPPTARGNLKLHTPIA